MIGNLYFVGWISNTLSRWDGKTTTVQMLEAMLRPDGRRVIVIVGIPTSGTDDRVELLPVGGERGVAQQAVGEQGEHRLVGRPDRVGSRRGPRGIPAAGVEACGALVRRGKANPGSRRVN